MASKGIRDQVAIVGMGCTAFGEHWDRSVDDMLIDATTECYASTKGLTPADVDAYWLGTMASGLSGMILAKPLALEYKPVTRVENFCATGSEAFRNACYAVASGAYDIVMAVGVEKLKDSGFSGLVRPRFANDGTSPRPDADRAGRVLPARPGLLPQVRRGPGRVPRRDDPRRVEEPPERREEPAGPVPQAGGQGEDLRLAAGGRPARRLRLLRRLRRGRGRVDRARRGRPPLHRQPDVREGPVARGRAGQRRLRPGLRLHHLPRGRRQLDGRLRPGRHRRRPTSTWPRCTTASPRPRSS